MKTQINGVEITLTQEQIEHVLNSRNKKSNKEEAKAFLLKILSKPFKTRLDLEDNTIVHYQNEEWLFTQNLKNKTFWVSYYNVWYILLNTYSLQSSEIESLIKEVVLKPFNCEGFTLTNSTGFTAAPVLKPFNCDGFTLDC